MVTAVDIAGKLGQIEAVNHGDGALFLDASRKLLELRRLLEAAFPAVQLFADDKTFQAIRLELGL